MQYAPSLKSKYFGALTNHETVTYKAKPDESEILFTYNHLLYSLNTHSLIKKDITPTQKRIYKITSVAYNSDYKCIGYKSGKILINDKLIKIGKKPIEFLDFLDTCLLIGSHKTIYFYNLETQKMETVCNTNPIKEIISEGDKVYVLCTENIIRVYKKTELVFLQAFKEAYFGVFVIHENIYAYNKSVIIKLNNTEGEENEKPLITLKGIIKVKFEENKINILTEKKFYVFSKQFENINAIPLNNKFKDFHLLNFEICLIGIKNLISVYKKDGTFRNLVLHETSINSIQFMQNILITISEHTIISYSIEEGEYVQKNMYKSLNKIISSCQKNKSLKILCEGGIVIKMDMNLNILKEDFNEKLKSFDSSKTHLIEIYEDKVEINSLKNNNLHKKENKIKKHKISQTVIHQSEIIFAKLCHNYVGISSMSNKFYIYNIEGEKVCEIFGHSLPVLDFDINLQNKCVITTGADKLCKLWGLEFGELRKTFHDEGPIKFISEDSANKDILFISGTFYYRNYEKIGNIKSIETISHIRVIDNVIYRLSKIIEVIQIGDTFFKETSSSSDEAELIIKAAEDFTDLLENSENEIFRGKIKREILKMEALEIKRVISHLCLKDIDLLIPILDEMKNSNLIVLYRWIMQIIRVHRLKNDKTQNILKSIKLRVERLEVEIGTALNNL